MQYGGEIIIKMAGFNRSTHDPNRAIRAWVGVQPLGQQGWVRLEHPGWAAQAWSWNLSDGQEAVEVGRPAVQWQHVWDSRSARMVRWYVFRKQLPQGWEVTGVTVRGSMDSREPSA
jgi:hypothetical protein